MHRFANGPVRLPDGLHWDILRLWSEIKTALHIATHKHDVQLAGIGIDTWGVDFGLLDRTGALLGNPYHYRDSRTDGMMDEAFKRLPREQIFDLTGIQFMQFNTLYQLFAHGRCSKRPHLQMAETFLTMPDLLNYWLSGRKACEFTHGDHDAVLRSAPARVVEAAARRAGHSDAHFPGSGATRYRVRRSAAGNRRRDSAAAACR